MRKWPFVASKRDEFPMAGVRSGGSKREIERSRSASLPTWLLVAAEEREFDGIRKRLGSKRLGLSLDFACESEIKGERWVMVANGAGREAAGMAVRVAVRLLPVPWQGLHLTGIVSTGFCGALDPALHVGDIVEDGLVCSDRVAVTAAEKAVLRAKTGAAAVDMESAEVAERAREIGVPFRSIRAVSDVASEDLPLDFNLYIDAQGRIARTRIALDAMKKPFTAIPALMRLDRNCRIAAESLGEFFVNRGL
jgi:adenosylhomocysteine nucleosidase